MPTPEIKPIRNPENINFAKYPIPEGYVVASEEDCKGWVKGDWMVFSGGRWGRMSLPIINRTAVGGWTYIRPIDRKPILAPAPTPEPFGAPSFTPIIVMTVPGAGQFNLTHEQARQALDNLTQAIHGSKEEEADPHKLREKYGESLIRVNWQFARAASRFPNLKHVCTWPNGDEGFVLNDPLPKTSAMTVNPGEGYRILQVGEVTRFGDEWLHRDGSWVTLLTTSRAPFWATVRRRITPIESDTKRTNADPGDGWRLLQPGEVTKDGDQYQKTDTTWVPASAGWAACADTYPIRRRVDTEKRS